MDLQLQGRRALVTGAGIGIGAAIAQALAAEGVSVVVHGRSQERVQPVVEAIVATGGRAASAVGNLSTDSGADQVAEQALSSFGGVDVLVNNVGAFSWEGWWDASPDVWAESYAANVLTTVRMVQRLVPPMRAAAWGRVINIGSAAGVTPPGGVQPFYAAAKAAQIHLGRSLALELAATGVTVNTVSPGPVASQTNIALARGAAEQAGVTGGFPEVEEFFVDQIMLDPPVPRMARVEEVAGLVTYLSSPLAGAISGANYLLDAGFSLTGFRRPDAGDVRRHYREEHPYADEAAPQT